MEEALWESCNKMRGAVEPSEYKHVVLSLIFLKYAGDHFEQKHKEICEKYGNDYADMVKFYAQDNVFYVPAEYRWAHIMENAKQDNIFQIVDDALANIECYPCHPCFPCSENKLIFVFPHAKHPY